MKKLMLVGALALFSTVSAQAGFKLGANVGLPMGDAADVTSFTVGVDGSYLWPVAADFNLGIASGYSMWIGKDVTIPAVGTIKGRNINLVPIAASGQYKLTPEFSLGLDIGYGIFFGDNVDDGGLYYAPKAAYHFGQSEINLSYRGVSDEGSASSINLGYAYSFGK